MSKFTEWLKWALWRAGIGSEIPSLRALPLSVKRYELAQWHVRQKMRCLA